MTIESQNSLNFSEKQKSFFVLKVFQKYVRSNILLALGVIYSYVRWAFASGGSKNDLTAITMLRRKLVFPLSISLILTPKKRNLFLDPQ
jgi:hypothetical protein